MPYTVVNGHGIFFYDSQVSEEDINKNKIPILMIHGLGSSHVYYLPVIAGLGAHRCIAMDTYGAAGSKSSGQHLSLEQLASDVVGLMDKLSIAKAVIVGHSMGGPMACLIAASNPNRVAGLVCIGPVDPSSVNMDMWANRINIVQRDGMEPLASSIPTAATNINSTVLQRALIRSLLMSQEPTGYASHCRVIMEWSPPDFSSVRAPTLILAGDEDRSAPMEGCEHILAQLTQSKKELKVLDGVGHWHCIEASDAVSKHLAAFAADL